MTEEMQESTITDGASIEGALPPQVETATHESTENGQQQPVNDKPAGYAPVDLSALPPEVAKPINDRINYIYGQVKHSEREKKEMRQILSDQSRIINELTQTSQAVVNHLADKTINETEASIYSAMQQAWEKGDNKAYMEAQGKLIDLQVQKRLRDSEKPKQQTNGVQPSYANAAEISQAAVNDGSLSEVEYRTTAAWQNERDDQGNLIRPWAFDSNSNYQAALDEAKAVFTNPRYASMSYEKKLAEIDKRMGVQKQEVSQTVLGGGLTRNGKQSKLTLSPKQQEIAIRTKFGGPKAKSDADHLDAYRKQIEKVNSMKGSRK